MAKIIGPLGSGLASGTLDRSLIYSHLHGKPYTKRYRKPRNPRTQLQTGLRSAIPFLTREWSNLSQTDQQSWSELAEAFNLPNYQAFLKANLGMWPDFIAPIKNADNPGSDTSGFLFDVTTYYQANQVLLRPRMLPKEDCWGIIFCMHEAGYPTQSVRYTVAILPIDGTGSAWYIHRNMTPGIYYYDFAHFTNRGTLTISTKARRIIIT